MHGRPEIVRRFPRASAGVPRLKSQGKSRVSNGSDLLPGVDGRSIVARRYRDIANAILADQGGVDQCSESRIQLIRRFAAAAVLAEQMEAKLANGEQIDVQEHALLTSSLVRVARQIGVNRIAKDITPSLGALIAADQVTERQRLAREREVRRQEDASS